MRSDASSRAGRNGMVAAEYERKKFFGERFLYGSGDVCASLGNFLKILGAFFADGHFFGLLHFQVADVFHRQAEFLESGLKSGAAQGGGTHIHAAAALAEVHGYADDANFL